MSGSNVGAFPQAALESFPRSHAHSPVRATAGGHNLFADAIIDESAGDRGKRAARAGLAFTIQVAIVGGLLLVPLLFTEGLDLYKFNNTVLLAPPPPPAPPPPAVRAQVIPKQSLLRSQLTAPTVIPKNVVENVPDAGAAAPTISDMNGVPGGTGDVFGGLATGAPPPPPPAAAPKPKDPLRIYSGMKEPALLFAPPVIYPPIARAAHVSGTVVIEAIIDEQGKVTQVKVVSGPGLLVESALKAVIGRKYQPTLLDGQPVSIRFDVRVDFRLS